MRIEIRLCSIECARWLDSLANLPANASIPSPKVQLGLMFGRLIEGKRRECGTTGALLRLPADGLVMVSPSDVFESIGFAVSIVHAAALAAVIASDNEQKEAYELAAFFEGKEPYNEVPPRLGTGGAYSCLTQADGERFAPWLKAIPRTTYDEEVADMFGSDLGPVYRSGLESLTRIMQSMTVHGADLCCVRCPGQGQIGPPECG